MSDLCAQMAAKYWSGADAAIACAVCHAESGGNPTAHCLNCAGVIEDSRGLFQINVGPGAHTEWAGLNLYDPTVNAQIAYQLWQSNGWNPWTTYTRGAYKKYLGQCGSDSSGTPGGLGNAPTVSPASAAPLVVAMIAGYLILDWL